MLRSNVSPMRSGTYVRGVVTVGNHAIECHQLQATCATQPAMAKVLERRFQTGDRLPSATRHIRFGQSYLIFRVALYPEKVSDAYQALLGHPYFEGRNNAAGTDTQWERALKAGGAGDLLYHKYIIFRRPQQRQPFPAWTLPPGVGRTSRPGRAPLV